MQTPLRQASRLELTLCHVVSIKLQSNLLADVDYVNILEAKEMPPFSIRN
jgi:hypothetical protein